jgi:hypothetical protein
MLTHVIANADWPVRQTEIRRTKSGRQNKVLATPRTAARQPYTNSTRVGQKVSSSCVIHERRGYDSTNERHLLVDTLQVDD